MSVGEPSYTSGAQKWNGAADTLNSIAIKIMTTPMWNMASTLPAAAYEAISARLKLPDAPYTRVIPNSNIPDAKDPIRKYFMAASLERMSFLLLPANM